MIARLVLGYVVAALFFVLVLGSTSGVQQWQQLSVVVTVDAPGQVAVYYDTGRGLREADKVAVDSMPGKHEYRLPLPPGDYKMLRIDPGTTAGRYVVERVAIRNWDGSLHQSIPVEQLMPMQQLSVVDRTASWLIVQSPPGQDDPQLLYVPPDPIPLGPARQAGTLLLRLAGYWVASVLAVLLLELAFRPMAAAVARGLSSTGAWSEAHPRTTIVVAAALATIVATYPLLFLNRSLTSPNNGGTAMLYDRPPFVPGFDDRVIEDVRGSDAYAMMAAFLPYSKVQRDALSQRELPLWNRFNGTGRPLWGQGQTFLADPLHWVVFVDPDRGQDLKFVLHRFVFAAGVGIVALAGGCGWLPAALATIAVPFLGFYSFRLNHPAAFALSYGPWIVLAWLALASARSQSQMARAAILLTVTTALVMLASPPKEAVVVIAGCQAAGLLALVITRQGREWVWTRLAFAAAAGVAVVALTAPHWIIFLDTLRVSWTLYDRPGAALFPLEVAPQLLLGSLNPILVLPVLQVAMVPLLCGVLTRPRELLRRPAILACLIVGGGLMGIAFGAIPAQWLMQLPLVANISQINNTATTAALVLLSVACAMGAESLLRATLGRALVVTLLVSLASAVMMRGASFRAADASEIWVIALMLCGAAAVPSCIRAVGRAPTLVLPKVSLLAVGALVLLPGGLHVETGMSALDRLLTQPRLRVDMDAVSPAVDAIHHTMTEPQRTIGLGVNLRAGSQGLYGLEGLGGPDALTIAAYDELVDAGPIERPDGPRAAGGWLTMVTTASLDRLAPLLDLLNVGFVLTSVDNLPQGLDEVRSASADLLKVFRRRTAWPRAFSVDGVTTYTSPQDLLAQVAAHRSPLAAILSSDRQALAATGHLRKPSAAAVPAHQYTLTTNTTSFAVRTAGPGLAVLIEMFLPEDFRATLNGHPVAYLRVNHTSKGVLIPAAGEWIVKFEYRPHRWNVSLAVAGFGVLLLSGLAFLARRRDSSALRQVPAHVEPSGMSYR